MTNRTWTAILAVDPGLHFTGIAALVENSGSWEEHAWVVEPHGSYERTAQEVYARFLVVKDRLRAIHPASCVAQEDVRLAVEEASLWGPGGRTARGAIVNRALAAYVTGWLEGRGIGPVVSVSPAKWKRGIPKAVTRARHSGAVIDGNPRGRQDAIDALGLAWWCVRAGLDIPHSKG